MRDGRVVRTGAGRGRDAGVAARGDGRPHDRLDFPPKAAGAADAPVPLSPSTASPAPASSAVVASPCAAGEIVGLAGLVGAGRSELAHAVFGSTSAHAAGRVRSTVSRCAARARRAIAERLSSSPESRRTQGLVHAALGPRQRRAAASRAVTGAGGVGPAASGRARRVCAARRVEVRRASTAPISSLSGGNQQKVLFARWLVEPPRVLIADEPTRGVDVASKQGIYACSPSWRRRGPPSLLISSELEEILGMSHRVLVMRHGRITAELIGDAITEDRVVAAAFADAPTAIAEDPPAVTTAIRRRPSRRNMNLALRIGRSYGIVVVTVALFALLALHHRPLPHVAEHAQRARPAVEPARRGGAHHDHDDRRWLRPVRGRGRRRCPAVRSACRERHRRWPCSVLAVGCLVGAGFGTANGLLITTLRVNSFITTLATSFMIFGIRVPHQRPLDPATRHRAFGQRFARSRWFGLTSATWIAVAVVAAAWVLLSGTASAATCSPPAAIAERRASPASPSAASR